MSNIVKIKPIDRMTWSGFVRYKNTKDYITPHYDQSGTIVTGLNPEDQARLEKILKRDLSPVSSFWHDYAIILTDKEKVLNLDNPEHELAYKFLLANKKVANSETERMEWPYAEYIIYNEELEAQVKNEKFTVKRKAVTAFNELSASQMRDILKLYPGFTKIDSVSPAIIETRLYELMEQDPAKFISLVQDKKLDMKVFLKDLVGHKILRKNKSAYYYGTDNIGHDEESTITYLEDPQNQGLLIALKQSLEESK